MGRGRRIDRFTGPGVDYVVLDLAVFARRRSVAANAPDQAFVNLPDESFRDRLAAPQIARHKIEGIAVVEQFPRIVRVCFGYLLPRKQSFRLFQGEPRAFNMSRVVGPKDCFRSAERFWTSVIRPRTTE